MTIICPACGHEIASPAVGGLTGRQRDLMLFINEYVGSRGCAPSMSEMASALGMTSKSNVYRLLTGLEERGFIARRKHAARAIEILRRAA